jgi:hypothetical protein
MQTYHKTGRPIHCHVLRIEARVRRLNAAADDSNGPDDAKDTPPFELLTPRRGTPGLHPIVDRGESVRVTVRSLHVKNPLPR